MIVVGVDLAASAGTTAIARLDGLRITHLAVDVDDAAILELCAGADKIGIDCPFGWPADFVDFVAAHRDGHAPRRAATVEDRRPLAYRVTDLWCRQWGMRPLSVSADRIGHAAMRCAGLLRELGITDRSGADRAVETYPAGSLLRWGLRSAGYKGRLDDLPDDLLARVALTFARPADAALFHTVDHAFDAVVAALTASAAQLGLVEPIPAEHREIARVEGWIAIPRPDTLAVLAGAVAGSTP